MVILRRLLLIKDYSSLTPEEKTLYRSYKNRVTNLIEYAKNPARAEWSFPVEIFHNLTPENFIVKELCSFYRALFDVTSYYQHNTAGIAKFGNVLISKLGSSENLFTELHLKDLPSKLLGDTKYEWIGADDDDITTDVVNKVGDTLIFFEFKFRVDSGCTAGRREVWEAKFLKIIQHIIDGKKLFKKDSTQQSLYEILKKAKINTVELYIGILFDTKGNPATVEEDKKFICFGGMQKSYQRVLTYLNQNNVKYREIKPINPSTEIFLSEFDFNDIKVKMGAKYANSAIDGLFKGKGNDLATIKSLIDSLIYDDLWLSQLIAISERSILLLYENNYLLTIEDLLRSDSSVRMKAKLFSQIRYTQKERALETLIELVEIITKNHKDRLTNFPKPIVLQLMQSYTEDYSLEDYIADIVQVLIAGDLKSLLQEEQPTLEEY
jgi:hypothetical protein